MSQSDFFTPKHLARNVHEKFDEVCERIRMRDFSSQRRGDEPDRRYKAMFATLGGDQLSDKQVTALHSELDDISIRFLAIQITIDRRISVKKTHGALTALQSGLRRAISKIDDPDLQDAVLAIKGSVAAERKFRDCESIMAEPSLLEKIDATRSFLEELLGETAELKKFFDYKNGLAKAGQPSLYARVFAVHALANVFERNNPNEYKASVSQKIQEDDPTSGGTTHNLYRYTGPFLDFVRQFYMIYVPDEVIGRGNEGFADQIRRLAHRRSTDLSLVNLMMGSVTVENTLEFMKRADAVK